MESVDLRGSVRPHRRNLTHYARYALNCVSILPRESLLIEWLTGSESSNGRRNNATKNNLPDERSTSHAELFAALRAKLKSEVTSSAMLGDLLQKVNGMQEVQACPAEFKGRFDEFVGRAE